MKKIKASSAEGALRICRELQASGKADLFRGQTRDWPRLIPSLLRSSGSARFEAKDKLSQFLRWAEAVPQMAIYEGHEPSLIAIAQHYGIPTNVLDVTTIPEVAILFSKFVGQASDYPSVVYCFSSNDLSSAPGVELLQIDVANLWRLEAQAGLFVEFKEGERAGNLRDRAIRIVFPSSRLSVDEHAQLYPVRKSALESVLDQWFYRGQVEAAISLLKDIKIRAGIKRETYPGAFRWRAVPDIDPEWIGEEPQWLLPSHESVALIGAPETISIPSPLSDEPQSASDAVRNAIETPLKQLWERRGFASFHVSLSNGNDQHAIGIAKILERCWDGMRVLPHAFDEVLESISLTAAFLCARSEGCNKLDQWPTLLWGQAELVDIAPVGGHLEAAYVSTNDLRAALWDRHYSVLTSWARRRAESNPSTLMSYVVDPWVLLDFRKFRKMFIEQFVPTAIDAYWQSDLDVSDGKLEAMWSVTYNPAVVGFVTDSRYRFESPMAMEADISQVIFVSPDMEFSDLEEIFVSCLLRIYEDKKPYGLRFTDYNHDARELWEIDRVLEQCRWIVQLGGISVLKFSPMLLKHLEPVGQLGPDALGAFEVWLFAAGRLHEVVGKSSDSIKQVVEEFQADWFASNSEIDRRAKLMPDWPHPAAT